MSAPEEKPEDGEGATAAKPAGKKKLIIIIAAALIVLLGAGGGAWFMLGGQATHAEGEAPAEEEEPAAAEGHGGGHGGGEEEALVDVPAMIVNLRTAGGEPRYLKIHFMLVPKGSGGVDKIKSRLPAIVDAYQPFLRELRPEDLAGSAAVFRIKEELLVRAADVLGPKVIEDVLIQDLVQQ